MDPRRRTCIQEGPHVSNRARMGGVGGGGMHKSRRGYKQIEKGHAQVGGGHI
jgi:hypothetical protein